MNNSAAKVGEIFREAGTAFNKLSEMTLMLQPMDDSPPGGKWSDAEVEMLRGCINRFAVELNKISQHIKNRTMRHLKCLLETDSGTIQDISSSPQQPQQSQQFTQQPHTLQESDTLATESQFDFNETLVNIFSQGFPNNDVKDEDIDKFLRHFDPSVVNETPPDDIMQEDSIQQQPLSEFEDLQDSSYDRTLQAVPSLISLLDADVNNATPHSECKNPTESCMANIGTLHAEFPSFGCNLGAPTGVSRTFQELNYSFAGSVSREAHFSLRQARDTWNHVSSPATNQTMGVPIKSEDDFMLYSATSCRPYTSVQVSDESAFTEKNGDNESQYKRQLDTVSSLLTQNVSWPGSSSNASLNNDPFESVQAQRDNLLAGNNEAQISKKEKPHGNSLWPGSFKTYGLKNENFGSVQTQRDNLLPGNNEAQISKKEKPHGNSLWSGSFKTHGLKNDNIGSVQAQRDNLLAGNNEAQISKKEKPHGNSLWSGSFKTYGLKNDNFGSVQAQRDNLLASNNEAQISKKEKPHGNSLWPGSFKTYGLKNDNFGSVQAQRDNLLAGSNEAQISKKEKPHGNSLWPGSFKTYGLKNDNFGSVQAQRDNLLAGSNEAQISKKEKPHGNSLWPGSFKTYGLKNDNFGSVQAQRDNLRAGSNEAQISKKEKPHGNSLWPGSFKTYGLKNDNFGSVQAQRDNLLAGKNVSKTQNEEKPHSNILYPGFFSNYSLNNDPFGSVQARNDEQKGSSTNKISYTNLFGNNLYSANPEPVISVPAQTNFSSFRADANKQALASSAYRTCGFRGRGKPRRRREGPVTGESADPIISPPDESTAEPSQGRMTKSRRRRTCHSKIEDPDKNKRSRKKAPTECTPDPRTQTQKKKQSPTQGWFDFLKYLH